MRRSTPVRLLVALAVLSLVVAVAPATVAAQSDGATGATVVVEEDETVDSLEAVAGTVLIEGTVTGDVDAVAGDVRIAETGTVEGDLESAAGSVTIDGTVDGTMEAAGGSVTIAANGTVGGPISIGAAHVTIDGSVESDAEIGAETIQLGDEATIAGDLRYGGSLEGNTDAVAGEIEEDPSIGVDLTPPAMPVLDWVFTLYALVLNLLLGAALLALFPRFSDRVADRVASRPVRTGLTGLAAVVGVPILLIALAITIVGIPFAIAGAFGFALFVWIGVVYGRFAVAAWLLSLLSVENRWLALVVGMVGGALLTLVPYLGGLLTLLIVLLGLGALAAGLYGQLRASRRQEPPGAARTEGPASD